MRIAVGRDRVVLDRRALESLLTREQKLHALVIDLRRKQLAANDLLQVALHELAGVAGASDRAYFARRWVQEQKRKEEGLFL